MDPTSQVYLKLGKETCQFSQPQDSYSQHVTIRCSQSWTRISSEPQKTKRYRSTNTCISTMYKHPKECLSLSLASHSSHSMNPTVTTRTHPLHFWPPGRPPVSPLWTLLHEVSQPPTGGVPTPLSHTWISLPSVRTSWPSALSIRISGSYPCTTELLIKFRNFSLIAGSAPP